MREYIKTLILVTLATALIIAANSAIGCGGSRESKIAFMSNRNGNDEIYVMNTDGTEQTRLTNNTDDDRSPSWSPDGAKIAFVSGDIFTNVEIYVMNADETEQKNLTDNPASDSWLSWSPDGKKIAFVSGDIFVNVDIYVMNADGTEQIRLTNNTDEDLALSWSPF